MLEGNVRRGGKGERKQRGRDREIQKQRRGRGSPGNRVLLKMVARIGPMDKILFKPKREGERMKRVDYLGEACSMWNEVPF